MTSTGPSVVLQVNEIEPLAESRRKRERLGVAAEMFW